MPIDTVSIGGNRFVVATYNPRNVMTLLGCSFILEKTKGVMRGVTQKDVDKWVRGNVPDGERLLEMLADGWRLTETTGLPIQPGAERYELPVVAWLQRERRAQFDVINGG